jgi:hypothetical protein
MPRNEIRSTLEKLHAELEQAPPLDDDLKRLLIEVDADIHQVLSDAEPADGALHGINDRLEALAADLAAQHPTTERFLRELINALGRMGI